MRSVLSLFLLLVVSCSPPIVPADVTDASDVAPIDSRIDSSPDVAPLDAGPDTRGEELRCTTSGPCGAGSFCDHRFPLATCTHACTDDATCGPDHACYQGICTFACAAPGDCDWLGGACLARDAGIPGACVPACQTDAGAGAFSCMAPRVCDPASGACVAAVVPTDAASD